MFGHFKERCYKLIAYPAGFRVNKEGIKRVKNTSNFNVHNVITSNDNSSVSGPGAEITSKQMDQLLKLLKAKHVNQA